MRIKKFSNHFTLILGLIGLLFLCCTSMKEFPQAYKGKQLHFGEGGGFTGALDYFVLFDDGRLFKRAPLDSTYTFQEKWEAAFVKQMFDNIETLQLEQMEFYEPGDKYYFIQFKYSKTTYPSSANTKLSGYGFSISESPATTEKLKDFIKVESIAGDEILFSKS